ncbi:type IV pilus modification protein PilV [Stagnimonas aquatica]|uniref:Type IV pilus modification protein PilV n=1 Tax=Stagnimonas aquatica TaxID=2689987 RepID=A0A3N0VA20_9GAMM|nr:type IV pilus modification protein PilV [Stagnimonas aquatica]ROH89454.1 type IV pilus modification protein PilV [Stagnimonas aquatica]
MQLSPGRRLRGYTLIEVLITVFIIAVGLLSAAALQAMSKKAAFDAIQRGSANILAQDLVERLRGNAGNLASYAPNGTVTVSADALPAEQTCTADAPCTGPQLAAFDLWQWWQSLDGASERIVEGSGSTASRSNAGGLRSPTGCILRSAGSCQATIAVAWRGMTRIRQGDSDHADDPTNNSCGQTRADYEWNSGDQTSYRRVLVLQVNLGAGPCP